MSNQIALTASMRSNLLSLKNTQSLLNKTQDRLSSGYKVNSAMDNPSSYFTAQALNSRADDLSGLLDSIGQAISTLEVADQGITTLQSFVEQAKSIANSARDTSNVGSKAVTDNVTFNPDTARTDLVSDYIDLTAGPASREIVGTAEVGLGQKLVGDLNLTAGSVTFTVNDEATNVAFTADDTVETFIGKVNTALDGKVKAEYVDGSVKFSTVGSAELEVTSNRETESHTALDIDFSAATSVSSFSAFNINMGDGTTNIAFQAADITVVKQQQSGATLTTAEKGKVAAKFVEIFNARAAAADYNAVAELDADGTTVHFKDLNEGATSTLTPTITGVADVTSGSAGDDYDVALTGTSFNEVFGMGTAAADEVKVSKEGSAEPGNSFSIRLGDATKMTGEANLRADKTLEEMGMVDGQSIDIIVGDDIHTYTVGEEIDKTSTMQQFMDDIVYDIGRTKIKAELIDGNLSISTLDNSSLEIRSTNQVEDRNAKKISSAAVSTFLAGANHSLTDVKVTPAGGSAITVDLAGVTTVDGIADAINANADLKAAGVTAKVDVNGNLAVFDKNAQDAAPAVVIDTITDAIGTPGTIASTDGTVSYELKGTSFNDLVGFKPSQKVEVTENMTVEKFRQAINNLDGIGADFDTKGHLIISGEQGDDLVMVNDANSNVLKNLYGNGVVSATNGSNERANYSKQFDNILTQIDELVQDTSYKGINLLNGDSLLVNFNESRTSSLDIKGVTFDSVGLGFTRSANEWISNDDIDKALNQISKATSMLRAQASEFGQNLSTVQIREDFTQNMINNLQSGADKLTLADMNEEAANMLALQTRQQLGVNSLSLASQASQSVLKLF